MVETTNNEEDFFEMSKIFGKILKYLFLSNVNISLYDSNNRYQS